MKKREAVRTILRTGVCDANGNTSSKDYVLCDDCPFGITNGGKCTLPADSLKQAQEWWGEHHGKDFTKHYKVGDWIKSDHSTSLITDVHADEMKVVRVYHNKEEGGCTGTTVHNSTQFYPVYPKEFVTTPRNNMEINGYWEYVSEKGYRTILYGVRENAVMRDEFDGIPIFTTIPKHIEACDIGVLDTGFSISIHSDTFGYKPVNLVVKL